MRASTLLLLAACATSPDPTGCEEARQYLEATERVGELTFTAQQLMVELDGAHVVDGVTWDVAYEGGIVQWVRATGDGEGCFNHLEVTVTLTAETGEQGEGVLWATEVDRAMLVSDELGLDVELTAG